MAFTPKAVPRLEESALVVAGDETWANWETVMVQHRWMEAFYMFEFSAIEPATEPRKLAQLKFNVGQKVEITLGGKTAIDGGVITIRQSAMDPERHGLQLIGKSYSWQFAKSSIVGKNAGGYDFSGKGIVEIAKIIAGETGTPVRTVGTVDNSPFKDLASAPGEPAWDFLEKAARQKGVILGADESGILLIGPHGQNQGDDIVEAQGGNVKRINVTISNEFAFSNYFAVGQNKGSDEENGEAVSQMAAGPIKGRDVLPSYLVAPAETPVNSGDLQKRVRFEAQIHDATEVKITVVVYGWLQPRSGDLWRVGDSYKVNAPDHLPDEWNNQSYAAQTVTFQQDEKNGTTTTLDLVLPWLLNGAYFGNTLPGPPAPADEVPFGIAPPPGATPLPFGGT
jgi:prophage tail gpP-like protein